MLLSIYVVSFNHEKFINRCIESIFCNTGLDFNVTVIDNGSTDGTKNIIEELKVKYNINVIYNEANQGLPATLNKILKMASSEYICFLAADDYVGFSRFKTQIDFLNKNSDFYGCSGSQLKVNESDECLPIKFQKNFIDDYKVMDIGNIFKSTNIIYSPTAIYRTNSLIEIGGYDESILIEDLYIYYKAAIMGFKFCVMPVFFTYYRVHDGNSHKKLLWMHENKVKILDKFSGCDGYRDLSKLIMLEGFYSLSSCHKSLALRLLPKVIRFLDSKYLYAGLYKLLFIWD